jgi:hypothetical protein
MPVIDLLALDGLPGADDPAWSAWLTGRELAVCRGYARAGDHMAARVAGKLAVSREAGLAVPPWQAIEISQGWQHAPTVLPCVALGPHPAPAVSLTHAGGYAAALAWSPWLPAGETSGGWE